VAQVTPFRPAPLGRSVRGLEDDREQRDVGIGQGTAECKMHTTPQDRLCSLDHPPAWKCCCLCNSPCVEIGAACRLGNSVHRPSGPPSTEGAASQQLATGWMNRKRRAAASDDDARPRPINRSGVNRLRKKDAH